MPRLAVPVQIPMALTRSPRGKTPVMTESVEGMISAPPTPISARAMISWEAEEAYAPSRLAPANTPSPSWRNRFLPKRSPSAPIVSRRPAKTMT
jgi:hypothetical protein